MRGRCEFDEVCEETPTASVRWVLGVLRLCPRHAWIVRRNEAEWGQAEEEYFG